MSKETAPKPLPKPGWHIRAGWGQQAPYIGVAFERLGNGVIMRVSFWPMRYGFYVVRWLEPGGR